MASWEVIIRSQDRGLVVYLTDGAVDSAIGRVAWSRLGSSHPLVTFPRQLRRVVARAEAEADRLNGRG